MATRELGSAPGTLGLLARAAVSAAPVVGARGGDALPDLELVLRDARAGRDALAAYARVCGFDAAAATLPPAYPHVLAFPLHLALMTDRSFPFPAMGLVHVADELTQHRPIAAQEALRLTVHATDLRPHPRGRTFTIRTQAHAGGALVWEEVSTMLRRGGGSGDRAPRDEPEAQPATAETETWELAADLGRRYAAVSGDRNPIHLHDLTAKPFGFPRAIAHGMWTLGRSLAALRGDLPGAFTAAVRFRKPILLPATVTFTRAETTFAVRDPRTGASHLDGRTTT